MSRALSGNLPDLASAVWPWIELRVFPAGNGKNRNSCWLPSGRDGSAHFDVCRHILLDFGP